MKRLSRAESREMTRQRLRSAASEEVATRGVSGASIDRIAETAGFSRGAFYANYRTKQDLMIELLEESVAAEVAMLQDLLGQASDLQDFLPLMEASFNRFIAQRERRLLSMQLMIEAEADPAFGAIYREHSARIVEAIEPLILELLTKSPNPQRLSAEMVGITFRTLVLGLVMESHRGNVQADKTPGAILTQILETLLC